MYETITLPNGVRVVAEPMSGIRSASVGVWVGAGSRMEKSGEEGSAHFIEHMLFKGTSSRSAAGLAEDMDALGGQFNAYTTRSITCFYTRTLDTALSAAGDILSDMFFESLFREEDVDNERGVILEEMDMYLDSPEDIVSEQLIKRCFPRGLGHPILGTPGSLAGLTGASLRGFKQREYRSDRVVIAIAGSYTDADLARFCDRFAALPAGGKGSPRKAVYSPAVVLKKKATEQNQLCLAWEGLPGGSEDRFAWAVLSSILGEGLSSRLFQTVREKYGLCYSIGSFTGSFAETGLFGIAAGVGRETELKALSLIRAVCEELCDSGVTAEELRRARELIKTGLVMGLESSITRMNRLGSAVLSLGSCLSAEEVLERYDAVTAEDVLRLARQLMVPEKLSFSAVGRLADEDSYMEILH